MMPASLEVDLILVPLLSTKEGEPQNIRPASTATLRRWWRAMLWPKPIPR